MFDDIIEEKERSKKEHRWSGWPGAYCLDCGSIDHIEYAIGNNWYDPFEDKWDTEEHRLICLSGEMCLA